MTPKLHCLFVFSIMRVDLVAVPCCNAVGFKTIELIPTWNLNIDKKVFHLKN